ncbi:MAG: TIGR01906 family membrane protein [Firmicutes bacterium]|nr:TIGR01906 family membrane protein [Bacillota bacterium]
MENGNIDGKILFEDKRGARILFKTMAVAATLLLIVGLMFVTFTAVAYNRAFYRMEHNMWSTRSELGIDQDDLDRVVDQLIRYFTRPKQSLQVEVEFLRDAPGSDARDFYTEDAISHMADVKKMFTAVHYMAGFFTGGALAMFAAIFLFDKKRRRKTLADGAFWGAGAFLLISVLIGGIMLYDFEWGFTLFHEVFFRKQGNWQFPMGDTLITLLPEELFMHAAFIILFVGLAAAAALFIYGLTSKIRRRKQVTNVD